MFLSSNPSPTISTPKAFELLDAAFQHRFRQQDGFIGGFNDWFDQ
jgi:hypothetical protein